MIRRNISSKVLGYARRYPVVTVTGPRQSGKTTLCKMLFPTKEYRSLEDLDVRNEARRDPRSFLEQGARRGMVLDEIQRVPELLSYIQTLVDEKGRSGMFIVSGSQNFELLDTVSQTLAGRTALATLLPFTYDEVYHRGGRVLSLDQVLYRGFYPRLHNKKLNPTEALSFYVGTYLERDIRSLIHVKDLSKFELFLRLCASRTGQLLNLSNLGNDCGINHNTARSWLSVLEASYIVHLVRPHHQNFKKRLVKSPKLYFVDVGLAAYLLDIHSAGVMARHPLKGALFETCVVSEVLKMMLNAGKRNPLYFFRDNVGHEVDLILDFGDKVMPIEIKMGRTIAHDFFKGLDFYLKLNVKKSSKGYLIYGGDRSFSASQHRVLSYKDMFIFGKQPF